MFENIKTAGILADLETIADLFTSASPSQPLYQPTPVSFQPKNSPSNPYSTPLRNVQVLAYSPPITIHSPSFSSPDYLSNSISSSPASVASLPSPAHSNHSNVGPIRTKKHRRPVQKVRTKKSNYCPCQDCMTARFEQRIRPKNSKHPCIIPGCKSIFARPSALKGHLLVQHERRSFHELRCFICNTAAFTTRDDLVEHVLDHEAMSTGFVNPAMPLPVLDSLFFDTSSTFDYSSTDFSL